MGKSTDLRKLLCVHHESRMRGICLVKGCTWRLRESRCRWPQWRWWSQPRPAARCTSLGCGYVHVSGQETKVQAKWLSACMWPCTRFCRANLQSIMTSISKIVYNYKTILNNTNIERLKYGINGINETLSINLF